MGFGQGRASRREPKKLYRNGAGATRGSTVTGPGRQEALVYTSSAKGNHNDLYNSRGNHFSLDDGSVPFEKLGDCSLGVDDAESGNFVQNDVNGDYFDLKGEDGTTYDQDDAQANYHTGAAKVDYAALPRTSFCQKEAAANRRQLFKSIGSIDLFAEEVGTAKLLLLDFQNITHFQVNSLGKQMVDPKASYLSNCKAHVTLTAEHHLAGPDEQRMARFFGRSWTTFSGSACKSPDSDTGTFGGVAIHVRKFLALVPPSGSFLDGLLWRAPVESPWLTWVLVRLRQLQLLLL